MEERPIFNKCCFYIPLSSCLIVWVVLKIMLDLTITYWTIMSMLVTVAFDPNLSNSKMFLLTLFAAMIMAQIDASLMVILWIGVCKKNEKAIRAVHFYGIVLIIVEIGFYMYFCITSRDPFFIWAIIYLGVEVYVAVLVRSELVKIRNQEKKRFTQMYPNDIQNQPDPHSTQPILQNTELPENTQLFPENTQLCPKNTQAGIQNTQPFFKSTPLENNAINYV